MEPEDSLQFSQKPAIVSYPEPEESCPNPHTLNLYDILKSIHYISMSLVV
jgi:hypothetical protein